MCACRSVSGGPTAPACRRSCMWGDGRERRQRLRRKAKRRHDLRESPARADDPSEDPGRTAGALESPGAVERHGARPGGHTGVHAMRPERPRTSTGARPFMHPLTRPRFALLHRCRGTRSRASARGSRMSGGGPVVMSRGGRSKSASTPTRRSDTSSGRLASANGSCGPGPRHGRGSLQQLQLWGRLRRDHPVLSGHLHTLLPGYRRGSGVRRGDAVHGGDADGGELRVASTVSAGM